VKFHQGVRLEIRCGEAAMEALCAVWEQNRQVSQAFSVPVRETGSAAAKMNEALANEKFRYTQLEKRLFRQISENYAGRGNVLLFEVGLNGAGVRELAECVSALCGGFAAVFSGEEGAYSYCIAQPGGDVAPICDKMHQALGGKGGGKPAFRQGRIPATEAAIRGFFADFP
jgi:alanyl-tRNA synthetase